MRRLKGAFITVEGIDGAGKTTQISYIENWIKRSGFQLIVTREPGGTRLGEALRTLLLKEDCLEIDKETELLIMFAARQQHLNTVILPALQAGTWVLSDRFTDATYAYQGGGRGIDPERISVIEQWVHSGIQPDLTLLLDVPVDTGLKRIGERGESKDRFESEVIEFKHRVREEYLQRAEEYAQRIKIVDASAGIDAVQTEIDQILRSFVDS